MNEFIETVISRPYVFAFFAAYLFLAWRKWGWPRTILWLVSGYAIAWVSEYSSIHLSFPYGEYHYVYENLSGELIAAGVPFFDSLSYAFLTFAGFSTAEFTISQSHYPAISLSRHLTISRIFFGALLTTLLDVIVDPIATMGDKWFLGKIHFYAHPGWYFGVPMSNFAGWFLVPLAIIVFNTLIWKLSPSFFNESRTTNHEPRSFLYPLFYFAIALFSIIISFWVGEWKLGLSSSCILVLIAILIFNGSGEKCAITSSRTNVSSRTK